MKCQQPNTVRNPACQFCSFTCNHSALLSYPLSLVAVSAGVYPDPICTVHSCVSHTIAN
jgi:hypothetical protein